MYILRNWVTNGLQMAYIIRKWPTIGLHFDKIWPTIGLHFQQIWPTKKCRPLKNDWTACMLFLSALRPIFFGVGRKAPKKIPPFIIIIIF